MQSSPERALKHGEMLTARLLPMSVNPEKELSIGARGGEWTNSAVERPHEEE